jgi:hypothetical protein
LIKINNSARIYSIERVFNIITQIILYSVVSTPILKELVILYPLEMLENYKNVRKKIIIIYFPIKKFIYYTLLQIVLWRRWIDHRCQRWVKRLGATDESGEKYYNLL